MSIDIDMESYAGANPDPAAAGPVDTNSYQEAEEYPVNQELLETEATAPVESQPEKPESSPQADNFRALREEVDRIKAEKELEKREYQLQLDMLRANLSQKPEAPTREREFLEGMKEDDIANVGELRRELRREWEQKEAVYKSQLDELQVAQRHPDYAEVLEKYVAPLVKQKPHLAESIRLSSNAALTAYEIGKMAQQAQEHQMAATRNENAQRIVENAKKPGTLSQAGGQGALSKADYFASMSDQEFMRMASKNLEGI